MMPVRGRPGTCIVLIREGPREAAANLVLSSAPLSFLKAISMLPMLKFAAVQPQRSGQLADGM